MQSHGLHYVVDVDIKGFFDNVSHGKLLKQLWALGIRDKKLLSILSTMLKAEVAGIGFPKVRTSVGAQSMLLAGGSIVTRSIPYLQDGKISLDVYVTANTDVTYELQPAFAMAQDKYSVATIVIENKTASVGDVSVDLVEGWNTIEIELMLTGSSANLSANGGAAKPIALNMSVGDYVCYVKERMQTLQTDGTASAAVADLNGNGYPDLILAQHMSSRKTVRQESYITVYWGGPDGYCENRKMQLPASCANSVTVGDYNGNGQLDIYATSYNNGRCRDLLSFLYKNNNGNFSAMDVKYLFNHSGSGCVSGDFNGDGYTDLAVACHKEYGNHEAHSFIFWGGPDGLSDERKTVLPTTGPHGMCTVDPGNIMDRGPKEHYTSEEKILPTGMQMQRITWFGECTSTSWVEVEVRAAESSDTLRDAAWIPVQNGADISALKLCGVVQYRLALCAKCSCGTPRILKVEAELCEAK